MSVMASTYGPDGRFVHVPFSERIKRSVRISETGCWEWQLRVGGNGYGRTTVLGKTYHVHRLAWEMKNGPIPDGLLVLHHCDNRRCCNPDHLFVGTQADNLADMRAKGRQKYTGAKNPRRGSSHHEAKLTDDQVRAIRAEYRPNNYRRPRGTVSPGSFSELATRFGVSPQTIEVIVRRKGWTHLD